MLLYFVIIIIKVSGPNLATHLEQTPIVELNLRTDLKINPSLEEIGPCACNLLSLLGSIVIINQGCGAGGTYMIILLEINYLLR
jgi:hypothetical protein